MAEFRERKRWVFLGLPWTFTVYQVREEMITVNKGFFSKYEEDCYMYKVNDVELRRSFWERIVGIGTVVCYTGDVTDQTLTLHHIRNSKEIKDFILEHSDKEKIKRRTVNMQNIGHNMDVNGDGIPDDLQ
ncbi:MAG: PH domain-containing protein [Lachnospiraceae bacterium]|nr:PH domain-containing protein [Lachnospiraceae bacterium]